jgi:hypothetical protein
VWNSNEGHALDVLFNRIYIAKINRNVSFDASTITERPSIGEDVGGLVGEGSQK